MSDALNLLMGETYEPFLSRQDQHAPNFVTILKRHSVAVDAVSGGDGFSSLHLHKMTPWVSGLAFNI